MATAKDIKELEFVLSDKNFEGQIFQMEPMSVHTTYKIGGQASFFIVVDSIKALESLLNACKQTGIEWFICGKGSNLLIADAGFKGIIIMLGRDFRQYSLDQETHTYTAGAAVALSRIVNDAFRKSYHGMEFAVGTPGTIGGAVHMDAGTRDDWIGKRIKSVTTFSAEDGVKTVEGNQIEWGYRTTSIKDSEVILSCQILLETVDTEEEKMAIRQAMDDKLAKRRATQPINQATCGSVFRNPEGKSAGKLIEDAGLKGCKCGGAQISTKHANFIVNTGGATALDVVTLLKHAQKEVYDIYGDKLYPEVKFVGFNGSCSMF